MLCFFGLRHEMVVKIKSNKFQQHQQHMKWHELNPGFVCQICFYRSVDKPSHKEHMELHTSKASSSLICVLCDKTFTRRDNFHKHIQRTHMVSESYNNLLDLGRSSDPMVQTSVIKTKIIVFALMTTNPKANLNRIVLYH